MTPARWLSDDEQEAWRAYLDATRLLLHTLDRQLMRDASISFTDFELLVVLSETPGGRLRMSELADAVTATRSGVTRAITRLVEAGWVVRVDCEDDRRGTLAELTPDGRDKLSSASPGHVDAVRRNMFDLMDSADVHTLKVVYSAMRTHLSE